MVAVGDGLLQYAGPAGQHAGRPTPEWQRSEPLTDSATFLGTDRLLVTTPNTETWEYAGRRSEQKTSHRVLLLDGATGATVDEVVLEVFDATPYLTRHPGDGSVLLDLGEGQDGSSLYRVRVTEDRLTADRILENTVAAGFSPDGTRLLLLPHPCFDQPLQVLSWPDLDVLATADLDAAGIDEGEIDFYGCFLRNDRILLTTRQQGLWVTSGDLSRITPIQLPDSVTHGSKDFSLTLGLSADTFTTRIWHDDHELSTVWRLR